MIFGPFNLLIYLLTTAVSLCILGGGVYFVWGWYEGVLTGIGFLVGGIAMLVVSFLGRPIIMYLLGRKRPGADPYTAPKGRIHRIARPDGSEICVEELGLESGPTLIFTHGLSLNGTIWNYIKQGLSGRYRLLIWDLPGFGQSRGPSHGPYTMETLAGDLQAIVNLAGDGPVVLAGHSLGGMVTLTYCRQYPQELGSRVAGLILAQTSFTNPVKTAKFHKLLTALQRPVLTPLCYLMIGLSPIVWLMNLQNYLSGMAHLGAHFTGYSGTETPKQLDFAAHYSIASSPAYTARAMLAMFHYDVSDILPAIPVPALVVTGDHDLVTLPGAGEIITESIPGAERLQLSPSGHLGLIERHEQFIEKIDSWATVCLAGEQTTRRTA